MQVFCKRYKVVLLALFPNLFWGKKITVKVEIKDAVININDIIWGCILILYLGSSYFRWKSNYKYGAAGFCCRISSMEMDEFMLYSKV